MRRRNDEGQEKIREVYMMMYACGALTFTAATLLTLPVFQKESGLSLYLFLIKVYSLLMVGVELVGLKVDRKEKWNKSLAVVGVLGAGFYWLSAQIYESDFNKGEMYIAATFFTSLASQLRILRATMMQKIPIQRLLSQQSQKFQRQGLFAIGHILFLLGTVFLLLQNNPDTQLKASLLNCIGGLMIAGSVYIMFNQQKRKGYKQFNQSYQMVIPGVV